MSQARPPGRRPLWPTQTHLLRPMAPQWSDCAEGILFPPPPEKKQQQQRSRHIGSLRCYSMLLFFIYSYNLQQDDIPLKGSHKVKIDALPFHVGLPFHFHPCTFEGYSLECRPLRNWFQNKSNAGLRYQYLISVR